MMRSLYSAVSGLKTHQTRMDVIGNNIANVNTEAFKASSVRFSEIMYQTTSGASAGNGAAGTGGKNAKQIGLGVKSGATAVNITGAGSAETTGNPFDLRLNDKNATNFFVVSDGTNRLFTRAGDFYVDGNGYLCMSSTGYTLQGWQVDAKGNVIKDTVSSLQVMSSATNTSAPEATTKAYVSGVLDKNDAQAADTGRIITIGFFDDLGYNYTAKFGIKKTNTDGTYDVTLKDIVDSKGNSIFDVDKDGNFITSQGPNGQTMYSYKGRAVDPQTIFEDASLVFDQSEGTFTSISSANSPAAKTINLNLSVLNTQDASINGSNFSNIEVDFSKSMNYNNNGTSTIGGMNGDLQGDGKGKALGALTGITVSDDGKIYGSYDNGNTVLLCQIAVAQFANASGLEKIGDNCYQKAAGSNKIVAIASSTGGPKALQSVIPFLPAELLAPVVLVQHMPAGFTKSMAERLNELSQVQVKEASNGEVLKNGVVYIAPGGTHIAIKKSGASHVISFNDMPPISGLKPCANIMFDSLTSSNYDEVVCVVLTGMGADGTNGILSLGKSKPIYVIAQDEKSSVVYGMPRAIYEAGVVDEVVTLSDVAKAITKNVGVK